MNHRKNIQNELQELNSNLPFDKPQEVYRLPEGYFENFAASVLAKIKGNQPSVQEELASLSPFLAGLPRLMPFSVPDQYFHQNTQDLPGLIEEEKLPDILSAAGKSMPYQVPDDYFNNFPHTVNSIVSPKPQAKVVRMYASKWLRYASAAIITGIIILGSTLYFGSKKNPIDPAEQPGEWIASKLKNVSTSELEEFIKNTDVKAWTGEDTRMANTTEVRKLLRDVPNNELDAFLSQMPLENDELSTIN